MLAHQAYVAKWCGIRVACLRDTHIARVWINRVRLPMLLVVIRSVFVCFLPVYSGRQVRLGVPAKVSQEKVTQDFSYTFFLRCMPSFLVRSFQPFLSLVDREVDICVRFNRPPQCFSSKLFWTSSSLDVPAGVTQEEGHTRFLTHLPSAVRALIFLARRNQPFLFLVDREVEICAERA